MSRSGYSDDYQFCELYGANVERTISSKRGQAFLHELIQVLDAMPEKRLIAGELIDGQGQCCTIGAFFKAKKIDVDKIDYYEREQVGKAAGITGMMAAEIEYMNDEYPREKETPEERWTRMRKWTAENLK